MQSEQMSFQSVAEDVQGVFRPDVSWELVLPFLSQDSKQSGFW